MIIIHETRRSDCPETSARICARSTMCLVNAERFRCQAPLSPWPLMRLFMNSSSSRVNGTFTTADGKHDLERCNTIGQDFDHPPARTRCWAPSRGATAFAPAPLRELPSGAAETPEMEAASSRFQAGSPGSYPAGATSSEETTSSSIGNLRLRLGGIFWTTFVCKMKLD